MFGCTLRPPLRDQFVITTAAMPRLTMRIKGREVALLRRGEFHPSRLHSGRPAVR